MKIKQTFFLILSFLLCVITQGQSNDFPYIHQIDYSLDKTKVAISTQEGISIYDDSMNRLSFLAFVSGTKFEDVPYISLNPDGSKMYAGGNTYMQILDTTSFDVLLEFEDGNIVFYTPQWNRDSTKIAFRTNQEHATSIYSAVDGSLLATFDSGVWRAGNTPVWSPNEQYFATIVSDTIYILDAIMGAEITHHQLRDTEISNIVWSPDNSRLAIITSTLVPINTPNSFPLESAPGFSLHSTVSVIDVVSGTVLITIDGLRYPLRYLEWSPDGSELVGNDTFRALYVWDATTGELIDSYLLQPFSLDVLEYSAYGGRIILGYNKGFFSFPSKHENPEFVPLSTFSIDQLDNVIEAFAPEASGEKLESIMSRCLSDTSAINEAQQYIQTNQYNEFLQWVEQNNELLPIECANDLHLIGETLLSKIPTYNPISDTADTTQLSLGQP
jgi:WD40 repeat protein